MRIKLTAITLNDADRTRQDLGEQEILELMESFRTVGQIQPIVVSNGNILRAGRRRMEAASRLGWEEIEAIDFGSLSPLQQALVEHDENTKRKQLTWQEEATAVAKIRDLLAAERGLLTATGAEIARTLGISEGKVSEVLTLSAALSNPKVARRPTRTGALKTYQRERYLDLSRELARRRSTAVMENLVGGDVDLTGGVVYNKDCRQVLQGMKAESVDVVVTDPPWGIDIPDASQWSRDWVATYDDSPESVTGMLREVFRQLYRVLKPASHLYTFFPIQEIGWWIRTLKLAGFVVRGRPLIWFKSSQPSITDVYMAFMPVYEAILWAYKPGEGGIRRFFSNPVPEAWAFPRQPGLWHEHEKPVEMLAEMIGASTSPGEVVLDPFAGGGATLAAAFTVGRYYIGMEDNEGNFGKCVRRLTRLEEPDDDDIRSDEES